MFPVNSGNVPFLTTLLEINVLQNVIIEDNVDKRHTIWYILSGYEIV